MRDVDEAGHMFRNPSATKGDREHAIAVVSDWRAAHQYPLRVFRLATHVAAYSVDVDTTPIVASRLKRLPTIMSKCVRFPNISLSKMQDIGGARVVVGSITHAQRLRDMLIASPPDGFVFERQTDYVRTPKVKSGYRAIHLIYRCDKNYWASPDAEGLRIELQIRSPLQHAWATANEIVGTFRREELKSGFGDPDWLRYFVLASARMAQAENGPLGVHIDTGSFAQEFEALSRRLNAFERITAYSVAPRAIQPLPLVGAKFVLLLLDLAGRHISVRLYEPHEFDRAERELREAEQRQLDNADADVVLVFVEDISRLEETYPNYFADTGTFLHTVYPDWEELAGVNSVLL